MPSLVECALTKTMRIVDNKALLLTTDLSDEITSEIKKSAIVKEGDVAIHWGLKECQALTRIGVLNVPSPMLRDYKWSGKLIPFAHQKTTSSFLTLNKNAFCFNEQGTGKTASVIWAADYLMQLGIVKRVLIISPLSVMKSAWQQDLFKFAMHRSCSVAHGSAAVRKKILNAKSEFVVVNFDGLGIIKQDVIQGGFDMVVVDEANAYKNPSTNRWKVLRDVLKNIDWLWMLTGTPAAQSPLDAYGLAKFVNPEGTPRTYGLYRSNVMYKITQFKWLPKPGADKIVHKMLQPAIRFERADCLDLPPVTYVDREAPLTPMQKKYYIKLKKEMLFEADGEDISAVNAAASLTKLLQISCGAVYSDTREVIEFDVSNRLNVVLEVIREASQKVLVFVPFTHTIELLDEFLRKNNVSAMVIDGPVNVNKRAEIIANFQSSLDPRVLIIQPRTAAHGVTLTAADTIIWYSPVTSVETYLQANARINRPGQHHPMEVVHVKGSPAEEKLYTMLQANINTHNKIIDLYREVLNGE